MIDRQTQLLGTEAQKAQSVSGTLKRFGVYFRPYWLPLVVVLFAMIASTWMQVRIPYLTGQAIDCYLTPYVSRVTLTGNTEGSALPAGVGDFMAQALGETGAESNCTYTTFNPTASYDETLAGFTEIILVMVAL
jgi:ATP-binding cassette subfamily B protein